MKRIQEGVKVKLMIGGGIIAIIAVILFGMFMSYRQNKYIQNTNPELARAMEYPVIEDKEAEAAVEGTNYVQFDAFFLRDINQDGYAESIRGTCKEVGEEDTLYMNLNVLTNGYLKDGKITINSNNFYFQTAIPKDNEIKENAIGNNIKEISLNDIKNGTQKLITGVVHSGDYTQTSKKSAAIGNNKDNYSKINSVTITGTHVADDGTETQISKTVDFTIDWYGETKASISNTNQTKDIEDLVDEENGVAKVSFSVTLNETAGELIPNKANISGEIPELNGYTASKVTVTGPNVGFSYTYDETTRRFSATVESETNISKSISITVNVEYPIEAYRSLGQETLELKIPVEGYYECYNNPNEEFDNPIQSNVAEATVILNYRKPQGSTARVDVTVGKQLYSPNARYMVSKEKPLKIYNGVSNEEEDRYIVRWDLSSGSTAKDREVTLQETTGDEFIKTNADTESMEEEVSNAGIYFSSPLSLLGNDGWIKVYNDETGELIETFTKDNWDKYSSNNPYMYETKIKHIRIETSKVNTESSISIYHVKELDDEYITTNKTIEEFNSLQYIKSTLEGYFGKDLINKDTHQANYEAPMSVATMSLSKTTISTQETEKNIKITLKADGDVNNNKSLWKDGAFLVKLPKDILDVEINNVELNTNSVQIASYETYEEDGINYIKILTENENASSYTITIDCNLTADPRIATTTESFEMYASNEENENYYNKGQDIYDVNGNLNIEENVAKVSANMSLVSPNSLLTNETASEYDEDGNITIAPKVVETTKEQRTAKVNIELNNNYSSTISEVQILGRVPFEGNKYVLNGEDLGSTFTVSMSEEGIIIPEKLKNIAKVYYSENGEATNDLGDTANGWTETPTDFTKVKSYLIDLGDYVLEKGEKHTVSYNINIPEGINYNQVSYSAHAVYFSLDTEEGKYKTQSEPNKVGFMIAKQYDLEVVKYQKERDNTISGATYSIQEEGTDETKTKVTDTNGSLVLDGLYVDRTYILKEIKSPEEYELNTEEIRFVVNEDNGKLVVNVINGTTREVNVIEPQEGQDYRVQIKVEDEVKARLKIKKIEEGTDTGIRNVKFKITGENLPENGKILTTNSNGEIEVSGLKIGSIYTLEETKAEGYYLSEPIVFSINRGDRIYYFDIQQGTLEDIETTEENNIPVVNIKIANTKIPRYNLEINKVVKDETTPIEGVKFKLYKQDEDLGTYETDENGKITINDLYQYEESRGIDQTYTLKETYAPEGYAKIKDIVFNAETKDGTLQINVTEGNIKESTIEGNTIKITVEDSKSFKLTKKDGETAEVLPGVKFAIYNVEEGSEPAKNSKGEIIGTKETINGKEYYVVTTNENGEIAEDLPEGLYKAVEVEAGEKYDITGQEYYFGVGASREGKSYLGIIDAVGIGGEGSENIKSTEPTNDDGVIVGGYFYSDTLIIGDKKLVKKGNGDALAVKYGKNKEVEWATGYGEDKDNVSNSIDSIVQLQDGSYVAVGSTDVYTNIHNYKGLIIRYDTNGDIIWSTNIGYQLNDVIATSDGGYVIAGYSYKASVTIDGINIPNKGHKDAFMIKFDKNNQVLWTTSFGGYQDEEIEQILETQDKGIIAVGGFDSDSIQLGNTTIEKNGNYGLIIKYDSNGNILWFDNIGGESGPGIMYGMMNVCEDTNGNLYTNVSVKNNTVIGNDTLDSGRALIKYNKDGKRIKAINIEDWSSYFIKMELHNDNSIIVAYKNMLKMYNKNLEEELSIDFDTSVFIESITDLTNNDILISGYYNGILYSENEEKLLTSNNSSNDGVLITLGDKEENNPIAIEAKSIGGSNSDYINSVAPTSDGGYIVGGYFNSIEIQVGDYILTRNGNYDGMIIKYSSNREVEWARSIGGSNSDYINSVATTSDGGYIVGGYFSSSSIQVEDHTLTNNGGSDGMIIKYSSNGEVEWARSVGESRNDYINSVAATSDGGYIVGGYFSSSSIQVGDNTLTNNGGSDGMIIKYSSSGEVEWARSVGGSNNDEITSVASISDGGYIVGGYQGILME